MVVAYGGDNTEEVVVEVHHRNYIEFLGGGYQMFSYMISVTVF